MVQTRSMLKKSGEKLNEGIIIPRRRQIQMINVRIAGGGAILRDAIDDVCKYLNIRDLLAVSRVCRFWNAAAARELSKRREIERLLVPQNSENEIHHLPAQLRIKPHVALLFLQSKLAESLGRPNANENCQTSPTRTPGPPQSLVNREDRLSSIMNIYKLQLPHKLIGIEVSEPLIDSMDNKALLGLFFPEGKELHVRVSWCDRTCDSISDTANCIVDQLSFEHFEHENHESVVLLFAQSLSGYFLAEKVISSLSRRYPEKNEHIFGGLVGKELRATTCKSNESVSENEQIFVGLRIASPGLQTWMTIINCTAEKNEVVHKLQEFRSQVVEKRHKLGLAYGPHYIRSRNRRNKNFFCDGQDLMQAIKDVFTNIPFSGLFNRDCRILVGCNAMDEDMSQRMDQDKLMTLIVITYD